MKRYTVPMTVLATVTVTAPHRGIAILAAREFVTDAAPEQNFIRGYNDTSKLNGEPAIIMGISGFDVERITQDEVEEECAFLIVPQCDLNADLAPESDGTRFEHCAESEATQWAVFQYSPGSGDGADDLVEDYPTRADAEACFAALESGQPIPTPVWPKASPLDDLAPDLRAWLVDEMGMEVELGGGGCTYLRHEGPHGSSILVTCYGGGGMPSHDSWQVGAYRPGEIESVLDFASDQEAVTLRMAVGAACGVLADYAPMAKRWTLIVTRDTTESACVTVEADDEENARAEVMNMLNGAEWITDDGNMPKEPYVTDCQPADD